MKCKARYNKSSFMFYTLYIKLPRIYTYTHTERVYPYVGHTHAHIEKNYVQKYTLAAFTNKKVQNSCARSQRAYIRKGGDTLILFPFLSIECGPTNGRKKFEWERDNVEKKTHTHTQNKIIRKVPNQIKRRKNRIQIYIRIYDLVLYFLALYVLLAQSKEKKMVYNFLRARVYVLECMHIESGAQR